MKARIASQAVHYRLALPIFDRLYDLYRERGDHEAARAVLPPRTDCDQWAAAMLAAAHEPGVGHDGLPSMADLSRLRHAANLAAYGVGTVDGEWLKRYADSLEPSLAAVVESMFTAGRISAATAPTPPSLPRVVGAARPAPSRGTANGWHILAAVLALATAGDLLGADYSVTTSGSSMFALATTIDCGNGWSVLTDNNDSCQDEHLPVVLIRLAIGAALAVAAYCKAEQVQSDRRRN